MAVVDKLKQVFLNLLGNAADACIGGGVITITTEIVGRKNIVIRFEDSGIGIDNKNIAHIFEPFFTTKPEMKGTGLGLSVSYGIIKKYNGTISVENINESGCQFVIMLPQFE